MAAAGQTVSAASGEKPYTGKEIGAQKKDATSTDVASDSANVDDARWRPVLGLVCQLSADLPLPHVTVADFLNLRTGSVIATEWRLSRDVPLRANGTLIAWVEFEGSGARLAVRITEIA